MAEASVDVFDRELGGREPEDVLAAMVAHFGERMALASSFGAEDVVLIDMLVKVSPRPRVFAIDTGRLPAATYEAMDLVRDRYGIEIEVYFPRSEAVERLEREQGFHSFRKSLEARHACCGIRKVEPLERALSGLDAWITGLRREQNVTRTQIAVVERDDAHGGIAKVNPLADWTQEQVWEYIRAHGVPYNRLHDEGYPSIGCDPCTRAITPGEHPRAGRWWWESPAQKECGLHVAAGADGSASSR
jgi:phosphoadenosine phosphosulfate reductase